MPFYQFPILPWPHIQSFILRTWNYGSCNWIVKHCHSILMLSKLSCFFSLWNAPDYCLSIPRACHKIFRVYEIQWANVAVMFNHPDRIAMNVIPNNLSIYKSCNRKQSLSRRESVKLDSQDIFLYSIRWCLERQLSVLVSEEVNLFIATSRNNKVAVGI